MAIEKFSPEVSTISEKFEEHPPTKKDESDGEFSNEDSLELALDENTQAPEEIQEENNETGKTDKVKTCSFFQLFPVFRYR